MSKRDDPPADPLARRLDPRRIPRSGVASARTLDASTREIGPDARPDRYELDQLIEERPVSRVWTATDRWLDRDVRFEEMRPGFESDLPSREAFARDLRRMTRLDHPAFAPIHDLNPGDAK